MEHNMVSIILDKKRGLELSSEQIRYFVDNYKTGAIPDYQASALTMAICFNGMNKRELTDLTLGMMRAGDYCDLSKELPHSVDKHSTGGVGDKTTMIVAPLMAAIGMNAGLMSGRALGHTGGTVDKLTSIPGYFMEYDIPEFINLIKKNGVAVVGQSSEMVPVDKKLYALRDVTGTVDSIPLIASSIMSKKLAVGAETLVLDVKFGSGAFMKAFSDAKELAVRMKEIGNMYNRKIACCLTSMETPLGIAVGNINEIKESYKVLRGDDIAPDLKELSLVLAAKAYELSFNTSYDKAYAKCVEALENGSALRKFFDLVKGQGGDISVFEDVENWGNPLYSYDVPAPATAYIESMNTEAIGYLGIDIGAGRKTTADTLDITAGFDILAKTGEKVEKGEPIARIYSSRRSDLEPVASGYLKCLTFSPDPVAVPKLVYEIF